MNLSLDFTAASPAPSAASGAAASPVDLHPALWRASQVGQGEGAVTATGFGALDLHLPGGGWPHRALTELLLPHPGVGEMRLLAPALALARRVDGRAAVERAVMLFDPPAGLCGPALATLGLDARRWVVVQGRDGLQGRARNLLPAADVLWALEQALKSGHVGAVLAWLPSRLRADSLRRLQLAAQSHDGPAFVLRDADARLRPSAAPLRLALSAAGPDELSLRILKRRGPPLAAPLRLMLAPVLPPVVRTRVQQLRAAPGLMPVSTPAPVPALSMAGAASAVPLAAA